MYTGLCTVIARRDVRDETSKITRKTEVVVAENQPCKLSFETIKAAVQTETAAAVAQSVKLLIAPELIIKPGSKIVVEQNGRTGTYAASGVPAIYPSHQEIMLEWFRGWA